MLDVVKHTELTSIKFDVDKCRFCLDRVDITEKGETRIEFAFVWRGNKKGPDGFHHTPAYFTWDILGEILGKAMREGKINAHQIGELVRGAIIER